MNVGGAIQGHPMGTTSGALAMRQAMNKPIHEEMGSLMQDKQELKKEEETANKSREALLVLADFDRVWEQADFSKKKELFQSILDKVVVNGNKVQIFFANKVN